MLFTGRDYTTVDINPTSPFEDRFWCLEGGFYYIFSNFQKPSYLGGVIYGGVLRDGLVPSPSETKKREEEFEKYYQPSRNNPPPR